ncbi:hypothetical protein BHE74_00034114 [Ensete ventricosum]|nr:hypothetical protein GW17_00024424 [Ensete ventricosum]RWW58985.1 hypothetical protein BHE74_00034114 [Ensete ventricosum]
MGPLRVHAWFRMTGKVMLVGSSIVARPGFLPKPEPLPPSRKPSLSKSGLHVSNLICLIVFQIGEQTLAIARKWDRDRARGILRRKKGRIRSSTPASTSRRRRPPRRYARPSLICRE